MISKNILLRFDTKKQKILIQEINSICNNLNISGSSLCMIALDEYIRNRHKNGK